MFCLPLTAQAQIYLYASTKAEWKALAENSKYSNTEVYVTLTGDFTIDNDVDNWEDFKGTLDGNGHTITVDYKGIDRAPLRNTVGNSYVKNLRIEGTIENHLGWISYDWANPLVRYVGKGTLKVTNCHSRVHYKITDCAYYSCVCNAGFVGKTEDDGSVIFENCSYIGSIKTNEDNPGDGSIGNYNGGMIGVHDGKDLKIYNCFSYIDAKATASTKESKVGPFVGELYPSSTTYEYDNNYSYVSNYVNKEYGMGEIIEIIDGWWKQYARLSSGEIAYKLNKGKTDDDVIWLQTIGKDLLPTNRLESPKSKKVYYTDATNRENCGQWVTLMHPLNVTLPEGAKVYVVADIDEANKKVKLCKFNAESYAQTPIVVYCPNGIGTLELPDGYYNRVEQDGILTGNYDAHTAQTGDYVLEGDKFVPATGTVAAGYCYLRGGTANAYTIDTTSVADDVFVISSKSAWNIFKSQYSGKEVNAYLTCDLTLTAEDEAMESFKGTFDGQGHSIIYDFETSEDTGTDQKKYGLFYKASGNIKDLNITGKIKVDAHITSALSYPAPLAFETHGNNDELNIENCHSDVSYYTGGNSTYTGAGFIISPICTTINFKDCSFTGTFASPHHRYAGGFIGQHWSGATINLTNCFSDVHIPSTSVIDTEQYTGDYSPETVGYFIGKQKGGALTLTNCYAHNSSTLTFNTTSRGETIVSDSLLKNGEVTYKLQASRTGDDTPWAQTIGTDGAPQLKTFSPKSYDVKQATGTISKNANAHWATLYYPTEVTFAKSDSIDVYDSFALENGNLYIYENLSGSLQACTPALLYAENGFTKDIKLPVHYYNEEALTFGTSYLLGTKTDTDASSLYLLGNATEDTPTFAAATGSTTLPAWQCYTTQPFTTVSLDGSIIYSKNDWNTFKTKYNNKKQGFARLACDLTLTDDDAPMQRFLGTFDGQGHTITVNYANTSNTTARAPFYRASGTIRNLNINGTITHAQYNAPLACCIIEGETLNVENCHSSVTHTRLASDAETSKYGTGFISYVGITPTNYTNGDGCCVNFKDCSFTGGFKALDTDNDKTAWFAGFVTNLREKNSVNFENCLSTISSTAAIDDDNRSDYFVPVSSGTITSKNCYAQKSLSGHGDNPNEYTNNANVTVLSPEDMKSGKVTYLLNAGRTGNDAPWRQTVDTDTVPQLKLFSKDSKEVHEASGSYTLGATGWGTLYYPTAVTLADDVKAYTVSNVEQKDTEGKTESYVVLTEVAGNTLPAYTAAILCSLGEDGSTATEKTIQLVSIYYNDSQQQSESEGKTVMLYGVLESTKAPDGSYVMQSQDGKVAFYQVDANVAQPTIPAYRCALLWAPKDDQQSSSKVNLRFDDEPTAIHSVLEPLLTDGSVYDLQGRRVQSLQKGQIYIKNGQKFVVR